MCCPWYDHIMKLVLSIAHNNNEHNKTNNENNYSYCQAEGSSSQHSAASLEIQANSQFGFGNLFIFVWESHTVFCILFEQLLQKSEDQGLYSGNSITLRQYLETFSCIQTYLWTSFLWILLKCRKHFLKRTLFLIFRIENCIFYCISNGEKTSWVIFPL